MAGCRKELAASKTLGSAVPMVPESSAVWAGRSRSPRQTLRHGAVVVALAPLASLIFGPVVKEEPAASSTS